MHNTFEPTRDHFNKLQDFVRHEYNLPDVQLRPHIRGFYGELWRFDTPEGTRVLRLEISPRRQDVFIRGLTVMDYLSQHPHITYIPGITKTRNNALYTYFEGSVAGVLEWIVGTPVGATVWEGADAPFATRSYNTAYHQMAAVYALPVPNLALPEETFSTRSVDLLYWQWDRLIALAPKADLSAICTVLAQNSGKLAHRAKQMDAFAKLCTQAHTPHFVTHGNLDSCIVADARHHYLIHWDDVCLAPPERDAWFVLHDPQALQTINQALAAQNINYELRSDRLAYYCYHNFFNNLVAFLDTYLEYGSINPDIGAMLQRYFSGWIEDRIQFIEKAVPEAGGYA